MNFKQIQAYFFLLLANKRISNLFSNKFQISGVLRGKSRIRISGKNNTIAIGNGKFKNIKIGIDGSNNTITIEDGVQISSLEIIIQSSSCSIFIGRNTQMGGGKIVCCEYQDKVHIGSNSLIADDVEFWSCDGHSIYQSGVRINPSKPIIVSNNVWIGRNVKILKGVTILPNTVIGMGSLVTAREYPANVLIAGFPAKVIKEGITWSVERM